MEGSCVTVQVSNQKLVNVEREDGITWVVLNRPEKKNATNPALHYEMVEVMSELESDPETKVLVLTGAGDSFSAGQDLKEYFHALDSNPKERARAKRASHEWTWQRLHTFPRPTIAMVNGHCFGNAFTPMIACDFAVAADDALFGLSEINWGIYPGGMVAKVIADTLSYRDAMLYMMTGRTFTGAQASAMRLVTASFPRERLREETVKLARELLTKSPAALQAIKEVYRAVRTMDEAQAHEYMAAKTIAVGATDREKGRAKALDQFVNERSFKPGLESFRRDA